MLQYLLLWILLLRQRLFCIARVCVQWWRRVVLIFGETFGGIRGSGLGLGSRHDPRCNWGPWRI